MSIFKDMYQNRQFQSWRDFREVQRMLAEAMERGFVQPVPVMPRWGVSVDEKWYQDKETGEIYSLIAPDPPARGSWEKIDIQDLSSTKDPRVQ